MLLLVTGTKAILYRLYWVTLKVREEIKDNETTKQEKEK